MTMQFQLYSKEHEKLNLRNIKYYYNIVKLYLQLKKKMFGISIENDGEKNKGHNHQQK